MKCRFDAVTLLAEFDDWACRISLIEEKGISSMFTLLFGIYTFVICTVMLLLSVVAFVLTVPFDKQRKVVHELSRALVYMFVMVPPMWKRRVEGMEHNEKD